MNIIAVPAIAAVSFAVIGITKRAVGSNEKFERFIPLIAAAIGVICGVICYFVMLSVIPADNVVVAIVIGGASVLSATGTHQAVKQLGKKIPDEVTVENPPDEKKN